MIHINQTNEVIHDEVMLAAGDSYDLLKEIPDSSIKLILTSPPYNVGKEYEVKQSIQKYLEEQSSIIDELIRVLRDDGSICWQVGNYINNGEVFPLDIFYYNIFKDRGLKLRNRIVWHFGHGLHAQKRFSGRYETLLWFTKSDDYTFNLDPVRIPQKYPGKRHYKGENKGQPSGNRAGKNPSDIWELMQSEWDEALWNIPNVKANHVEKTPHPCQFPVELVERCVLALTDVQDYVLDPFAGVASTAIGSIKNGRKCIIFERDSSYLEIGKDRIIQFFDGSLKTRPLGEKVHIPSGKEKVAQIPLEWKE